MKLDAKTLTALSTLIIAIAGGVELRVQVGLLSSKVDRIETELRTVRSSVVAVSRAD
jgi:hypothetical protein